MGQLVPLAVAVAYGPSLELLIPAAIAMRGLIMLLAATQVCRLGVSCRKPLFYRPLVSELFGFGGWFMASVISLQVFSTLDRLLVGALAGASAVTHYVVPANLVGRIGVIPVSLASAIFPRLAGGSRSDREQLSNTSLLALVSILTPLIVIGLLLLAPFLSFWISPKFSAMATTVGQVLLLGFWFNGLAYIPHDRIQAEGNPRKVAVLYFAELLPYVVLLVVMVKWQGALGAAIAWCVRAAIDLLLMLRVSHTKLLPLSIYQYHLLVVIAAFVLSQLLEYRELLYWGVTTTLITLSTLLAWYSSPHVLKEYIPGWQRRKEKANA